MHSADNSMKEKIKNDYHSFLDQRIPELKQENPNMSPQDVYNTARQEWGQKKEEREPIIKKSRGRPKKIVNKDDDNVVVGSGKSTVSNGKRGRPPKNPLSNYIFNFEKFLINSEEWSETKDFQKAQEQLDIDQQTFQLFLEHLKPNSELQELLKKKNAPKKNRGRPKGSKNKSTKEEVVDPVQVIDTPPEVIKFNKDLDDIFGQIENKEF